MIQALAFGGYEYVIIFLGELLGTTDDSENGFFVAVELDNRDTLKKHHIFNYVLNPKTMTQRFSLNIYKRYVT